jgi:polar amino acid transport system substrate-binding protein
MIGKGRRRRCSLAAYLVAIAAGLASAAMAQDSERVPLRLCLDPDNLPFSSAKGAAAGFYVELGRDIAQALGRPFQPVWVPTYYVKRQIRRTLLAGACDGFPGLPDEASFLGPRVIFSRPILRVGYALVAPAAAAVDGPGDLHGRRVAVQFATPPQDLLAAAGDVTMVTVLSTEEAMRDLAVGNADAAFVWGPSAGWVNQTIMHGAYRVRAFDDSRMTWNAAIAFPSDRSDLRDQVNAALSGLDTTITSLAAEYGFPAQPPGRLPVQQVDAPSRAAASPADVAAGHKLFNETCAHCHGPDAVQGEQRRNLRLLRARYGDDMANMFMTTVTHGRVNKGMPNWSGILSPEELQAILAFLTSVQEPSP